MRPGLLRGLGYIDASPYRPIGGRAVSGFGGYGDVAEAEAVVRAAEANVRSMQAALARAVKDRADCQGDFWWLNPAAPACIIVQDGQVAHFKTKVLEAEAVWEAAKAELVSAQASAASGAAASAAAAQKAAAASAAAKQAALRAQLEAQKAGGGIPGADGSAALTTKTKLGLGVIAMIAVPAVLALGVGYLMLKKPKSKYAGYRRKTKSRRH